MTDFDLATARQRCAEFMGWRVVGDEDSSRCTDGMNDYGHAHKDLSVCALVVTRLRDEHGVIVTLWPMAESAWWWAKASNEPTGYAVVALTPALAWFMACDAAIQEVTV